MNELKMGAILSYLKIFITIIVALVYTPVLIRSLGTSEYGLYALIGALIGYLNLLDLGLGNAVVRYISRARTLNLKKEEIKLNSTFFFMYSIIGVLAFIIGLFIYNHIEFIFGANLSNDELKKAKIMLLLLVVNISLSFPLSIFFSIMMAYEKFIVTRISSILKLLIAPILTLPFLFFDYGAVTVVLITTIINIAYLLFNVLYCFFKLKTKIKVELPNLSLLKDIGFYSFYIFLGLIVDQIYWNSGQFILGIFSNTKNVAIYAICVQFIVLYKMFSTSISGLILPKISSMVDSKVDNKQFTLIMIKYGRMQFLFLVFILYGFILFGKQFINIWAGKDFTLAYYITLTMMIPLTIPLIQNVGLAILQAKNLHKFRSVSLIIIAAFNILISIYLVQKFGAIGIAISTATSLTIGNVVVMNIYYKVKLDINVFLFWKNIISILIPSSIITFICAMIFKSFGGSSLFDLLIQIIIFSLIFGVFIYMFGMNTTEREVFKKLSKKIKVIFINTTNLKLKGRS